MAQGPFFSVIIVNYNGGAYLQQSVDSLKRQDFQDFEVFIVDNASSDNAFLDLDVSGLAHVTLLPQTENLGFAKGNNVAAAMAQGAWLALLNPDAVARADWLSEVTRGIARHRTVDMFACTQISLDNPRVTDGTGDCYHVAGIPWRGGFERPISEIPPESGCFGPCGASAIYRAAVFAQLGGFDEAFFCYVEDVDLAFRIRRIGGECVFLPDAIVSHKGSAISGRASAFSLFYGSRNRMWAYVKNMPLGLLILTLPLHVGLSLLILLRGLRTGRAYHTFRGMRAGVRGLGHIWAKREETQNLPKKGKSTAAKAMAWSVLKMLQRKAHYFKV